MLGLLPQINRCVTSQWCALWCRLIGCWNSAAWTKLKSPLGIKLKYVSVLNTSVHSAFKPCMAHWFQIFIHSKHSILGFALFRHYGAVILAYLWHMYYNCLCQWTLCFKAVLFGREFIKEELNFEGRTMSWFCKRSQTTLWTHTHVYVCLCSFEGRKEGVSIFQLLLLDLFGLWFL